MNLSNKIFFRYFIILLLLLSVTDLRGMKLLRTIDTGHQAVFCTYRDHSGMLWVGTSSGLMSYPQLTSSMPASYLRPLPLSNIIVKICEDNLGRLWLRTQANRAVVYDSRTNGCIDDVEHYLQQHGVKMWYEMLFDADETGRLWFYKDNHLIIHNFANSRQWQGYAPRQAGRIVDVVCLRQYTYVVCEQTIFKVTLSGNRLAWAFVAKTPKRLPYMSTFMIEDNAHNLWLRVNDTLARWDRQTHRWTLYSQIKSQVSGLACYRDGLIYASTFNDGVYTFRLDGNIENHYFQVAPITDGLNNNHVLSMFYNREDGLLMLAYHKSGLSLFSDRQSDLTFHHIQAAVHNYLTEDIIVVNSSDYPNILVGTEDNGAYVIDREGNITENLFQGNAVTALHADSRHRIWAGLYLQGLVCNDGRKFFPGASPYNIIEINPHRFFVNLNGVGLKVLDPWSGKTVDIPTDNPWIMTICRSGNKVYGATPLYLYEIDVNTLRVHKIPAKFFGPDFSNNIKALYADSRGWIWMETYTSHTPLIVYDTHRHRVYKPAGTEEFLTSAFTEDHSRRIWCTTDMGIVCIDVNMLHASPFTIIPLGSSTNVGFNDRALITLSDGNIMAGATKGVMLINPQQLMQRLSKRKQGFPLQLVSLSINEKYISPGDTLHGRPLYRCDLAYLKHLELKSSENALALEFRPKDMIYNDLEPWTYCLKGLNDKFVDMVGHRIVLSNLPPGHYQLLLRKGKLFNGATETFSVLDIHVAPPFYRSIWAYLLYLVLLGTIVYFGVRYNLNRKYYSMRINFFTHISHDLRTPLTLIVSPLEGLIQQEQDENKRGMLKLIYRNARRLLDLINQILDIRRLNNRPEQQKLANHDIVDIVRNVFQLFSAEARRRKMNYRFLCKEQHITMLTDAEKLDRIVVNLISNSMKYTPDGGNIDVKIEKQGQHVVIAVADSGSGIAEEDKGLVFQQYFRNEKSNRAQYSTGLGLYIVKRYVEIMGGEILCLDNQPKGTIMQVSLPADLTDNESEFKEKTAPHNEKEKLVPQPDKHILVVEDNDDMRAYLVSILSKEYHVETAGNGVEALSVIDQKTVDVVLSDVMMDGMDGYTLCKKIKSNVNTSHIPVMLLTAKALDQDELQGLQMGASDYMTKPFNVEVMRQRIRLQLERTEHGRQYINKAIDLEPAEVAITTIDEQFLADVKRIIEANMDNVNFTVDDLSNELHMHRTNVYKKIQFITGKTPLQFLRQIRMKRAHQLMSKGGMLVSQVAYAVGFNNPKNFSHYFREEYGMYPSEYMKTQEEADTEK